MKNKHKWLAAGIPVLVALVFWHFGIFEYLTLAHLKSSWLKYSHLYSQNRFKICAVFFIFYVLLTSMSLPGSAALTLAGGAVFGFWPGLLIVSFAGTLGATMAAFASRNLFRDWAETRFKTGLERIDSGLQRSGRLYLFTLRLLPVIPYIVLNPLMGLTTMPLATFYWVSQIGMLPGQIIYVSMGQQIAGIHSPKDLISLRLLIPRLILALLALAAKKLSALLNASRNHS